MTTQRQTAPLDERIDADSVAEYLSSNPDFFEQHKALLASLNLPHGSGGGTVSLIERQVATLRQKNLKLDRQLRELISVGRDNDQLSARIHALTLSLIGTESSSDVLDVLEQQLRTGFAAEHAVLVAFADGPLGQADLPERRFVRSLARGDGALQPFGTFLEGRQIRCGQVRDAQRDVLFGKDCIDVGSMALVPLGNEPMLGFLAIGSNNRDHFHPAMATDFLARLGQTIAAALSARL